MDCVKFLCPRWQVVAHLISELASSYRPSQQPSQQTGFVKLPYFNNIFPPRACSFNEFDERLPRKEKGKKKKNALPSW